jgi:hypothetical protein
MKNSFTGFIIAAFFISTSCTITSQQNENAITPEIIRNPITSENSSDLSDLPKIQFEKLEHDFGILLQGEKVTYSFKFKNTGKQELIVKDASASCGCTVPKFTTKPIAPGEQGEIEVIFNSANRTGRQVKTITVWSNCQPNQTKLQIMCEIVVPK